MIQNHKNKVHNPQHMCKIKVASHIGKPFSFSE